MMFRFVSAVILIALGLAVIVLTIVKSTSPFLILVGLVPVMLGCIALAYGTYLRVPGEDDHVPFVRKDP